MSSIEESKSISQPTAEKITHTRKGGIHIHRRKRIRKTYPERKSRDGATDQAPTLQTFSVGTYAYRYLDLTVFKSSFQCIYKYYKSV